MQHLGLYIDPDKSIPHAESNTNVKRSCFQSEVLQIRYTEAGCLTHIPMSIGSVAGTVL